MFLPTLQLLFPLLEMPAIAEPKMEGDIGEGMQLGCSMVNDQFIDATVSSRLPKQLVSLSIGYCAGSHLRACTDYVLLRTCSLTPTACRSDNRHQSSASLADANATVGAVASSIYSSIGDAGLRDALTTRVSVLASQPPFHR